VIRTNWAIGLRGHRCPGKRQNCANMKEKCGRSYKAPCGVSHGRRQRMGNGIYQVFCGSGSTNSGRPSPTEARAITVQPGRGNLACAAGPAGRLTRRMATFGCVIYQSTGYAVTMSVTHNGGGGERASKNRQER